MRLAVISDIHGNLMALEAVLSDLASRGVDATINLGDCVAGPLWPRETFELLADLGIPTVRGNHDRWIVDRPAEQMPPAGLFAREALTEAQRAVLHALPATLQFTPEILAVHGTPTDDTAYLLEEVTEDGRLAPVRRAILAERLAGAAPPVLLCGHSHRQAVVMGPAGTLILNPGSVGCPAFADSPAAGGLEHRSPHARYAVLTKQHGRWGAELLALEYDWDAAARRADGLGWPRWARALATGSVE
ncbi:metallophosphatase family protein [Roseococcus sp. SDR]|uniref:metallophosphoesterase family protein n=1 Tax=Roseococcus sp. SDR TaxID=2835532 RepID=UPI001BD188DB|nr:metallophosphoesterase family protein [Roseococcus sp. SDR]MBS7791458.1 metallophosphoesterase family protein [Roseococcus sp. SDR]MBV1846772.1 metallophosphatase family protein [Roseococcus sp. SDR]